MSNSEHPMATVMHRYLIELSAGNYPQLIALFSPDAIVQSPLYGQLSAADFYQSLLDDTTQSDLTFLQMFLNLEEASGALHFEYTWTMENGRQVTFACVDIFQFNSGFQIKRLDIIYDTHQTRQAWNTLNRGVDTEQ